MQRITGRLHLRPAGQPAGGTAALDSPAPARTEPIDSGVQDVRVEKNDLRVLLVEDSPLHVQRIFEIVAEVPGVKIAGTATSEAEALACLEAGPIDAVILDLQLRVGSGFGILRSLHRHVPVPPVVVFTNFAIPAYRDTALALGASHFLDKSRDYDQLQVVLQDLSGAVH